MSATPLSKWLRRASRKADRSQGKTRDRTLGVRLHKKSRLEAVEQRESVESI